MSQFEKEILKEAECISRLKNSMFRLNFLTKVKEMRSLQKEYFKTRDKGILAKSKAKEKEIDEIILEIENSNEKTLFDEQRTKCSSCDGDGKHYGVMGFSSCNVCGGNGFI